MPKQYRPATGWANGVTLFMVVFGVITIASIASTIAEIGLLQRIESGGFVSEAEADSNDSRQQVIALLYIAAFAVSAIAFLAWIGRASANLAALGVDNQRFSPGWAVGWWFIPVMGLFRPYQVMKEIWKGSYPVLGADGLSGWPDAPVSRLLGFWWAAWLLASWVTNFTNRLFFSGATVSELIAADVFDAASDAILLVSLALVLILVRRITANQSRKHAAYQDLIEAGMLPEEADEETAQAPAQRENLTPAARPSQNPRCPRCGNARTAQELAYGVCQRCRSGGAL